MDKYTTRMLDEYDYMEMATQAETVEKAAYYAEKALKKNRMFLDAETFLVELMDDPEEQKTAYEKLIRKATKRLEKAGFFDVECIGEFWGIIETRPYMRLRYNYLQLLLRLGKFGKAKEECTELLRLCENDNLGVRYVLMGLYAYFEDLASAEALYKEYGREQSAMILLPLTILYYKTDNDRKAKTCLKRMSEHIEELTLYFDDDKLRETSLDNIMETGMYQFGSYEELSQAMMENHYLLAGMPDLLLWMRNMLQTIEEEAAAKKSNSK